MTRDLSALVERVAATVWERQKGTPWADLDAMTQHNCREAVLPFVQATLAAIDEEMR